MKFSDNLKGKWRKLWLSMSLTITDVTNDESYSEELFQNVNPDNFEYRITPPIIIRKKGKILCLHRAQVVFTDDIPKDLQGWTHTEHEDHEELTPEACAKTVAILVAIITKRVVSGTIAKSIRNKIAGKIDKVEDDPEVELTKLLEASL